MASRPKPEPGSTVDAAEVAQFSAYAAEWGDPRGKMAMLHRFNPVRLAFIKQVAGRHFGREERRLDALAGLRMLDIGCGGGILSEPLARLGAQGVGADPSPTDIRAAEPPSDRAGGGGGYPAAQAPTLAGGSERLARGLAHES